VFRKITSGRQWRMKAATTPHYERLNDLITEFSMFGSLTAYKNYLYARLASRVTLESMLDISDVTALLPDWEERKIQRQLLEDIADLRDEADEFAPSGIRRVNRPVDLPTIIGTLCAIDGSGAEVLAERATALGLTARFGARHLARQVENLSIRQCAISLLDTAPFDESDEDRCIQAAIAAFYVFERNYRKFFDNIND